MPSEPRPPISEVATGPTGRAERVTATGWRLVGRAAALVEEAAAAAGLEPGRSEDLLFGAKFRLRPRLGSGSAVAPALAALSTAIAKDWQGAPPLTPDRPFSRPTGRFQGLRWEPSGERGSWKGELVWRQPHPVIAGAPCTTQVQLLEQHGHTLLTVRVFADQGTASVRGIVGAGQARPAFLSDMHRSLRLLFDGGDGDPRIIGEAQVDDFVRDVLLSETREYPAAVLAPLEDGEFVLPPSAVADELLGLAHLYVLDRHPATFRLTDALGDKRLSCYWGALRVYLPEFSCADRPEDHPLLVRERLLDPVIRADLVGRLAPVVRHFVEVPAARPSVAASPRAAASATSAPAAPSASPPSPASASAVASVAPSAAQAVPTLPAEVLQSLAALGSLPGTLAGVDARLADLVDAVRQLASANAALRDEVDRLRTTSVVRAANTASLERRLRSLETLLRQQSSDLAEFREEPPEGAEVEPRDAEDEAEAASLVEVLRQAALSHPDALLVLDAAERAAADSPYEDTERLAVVLDAMAGVARRRQEGALGTSLKVAFREFGLDYRGGISPTTSARHLQQYSVRGPGGEVYDCREHIVLGTSYDPRFCLRIYFTSRAPLEPRFVIGHVGRHFDVATTT